MKQRCKWLGPSPDQLYINYHDKEWGVPVYDDRLLFEFLILEGAQAGLSWSTILKKRESYRECYDNFDPYKIAQYSSEKQQYLLKNENIVRNRLKIAASIENAKAFLQVLKEYNSFNNYIWQFVDHKPKQNYWKTLQDVPVETKESQAMSFDLKKRGFKFVGPTICYAFMQAVGMVNDHTAECFRHQEVFSYS